MPYERSTRLNSNLVLTGSFDMGTGNIADRPTLGSDAICKLKAGQYTGNGAESYGITGIGFAPVFVIIFPYSAVANTSFNFSIWKRLGDTLAFEVYASDWKDHAVISMDADGFTVDDAATDLHPNTSGIVYNYIAFG